MGKSLKFDNFVDTVNSYIKDENKTERRQTKIAAAQKREENQNLLKSKRANLRAKLGALGINPDEIGSALAVQKGLEEEEALKNAQINSELKTKLKKLKKESLLGTSKKLLS